MTILDAATLARMPAGPTKDHVMAFRLFLRHHACGKPCDCGVPMKRDASGAVKAQPSPGCECPCHIDGWVVG